MTETTTKQCDSWPNMTFVALTDSQWNGVGSCLLITFFFSLPFHLLSLMAGFYNPKVLMRVSAIPEICLLLADVGVLGLHPFSGSASFAKKWIWGQAGCQLYAFFGFLFGTFQLLVCPLITYARYRELKPPTTNIMEERRHLLRTYAKISILLAVLSFFWAICPVIGWASYNLTPVGIPCTIEWSKNDTSFITYVVSYAIFSVIIPLLLCTFFMYRLLHQVKVSRSPNLPWCRRNCVSFVTFGCCFSTYLAFFGYGGVAIFCIITDPKELTTTANLLPPPMVKFASVLNAIFFVFLNPSVCAGIRKMFGLSYDANLLKEQDDHLFDEGVSMSAREIKG